MGLLKYTKSLIVEAVKIKDILLGDSSEFINKLLLDPVNRTIWYNGVQYGNGIIGSNGAEMFNDYENNTPLGDYSSAFGQDTQTTNTGEVAFGKYNVSTKGKTVFSIGNGVDKTTRKNIFEITSTEIIGDNQTLKNIDISGASIYYKESIFVEANINPSIPLTEVFNKNLFNESVYIEPDFDIYHTIQIHNGQSYPLISFIPVNQNIKIRLEPGVPFEIGKYIHLKNVSNISSTQDIQDIFAYNNGWMDVNEQGKKVNPLDNKYINVSIINVKDNRIPLQYIADVLYFIDLSSKRNDTVEDKNNRTLVAANLRKKVENLDNVNDYYSLGYYTKKITDYLGIKETDLRLENNYYNAPGLIFDTLYNFIKTLIKRAYNIDLNYNGYSLGFTSDSNNKSYTIDNFSITSVPTGVYNLGFSKKISNNFTNIPNHRFTSTLTLKDNTVYIDDKSVNFNNIVKESSSKSINDHMFDYTNAWLNSDTTYIDFYNTYFSFPALYKKNNKVSVTDTYIHNYSYGNLSMIPTSNDEDVISIIFDDAYGKNKVSTLISNSILAKAGKSIDILDKFTISTSTPLYEFSNLSDKNSLYNLPSINQNNVLNVWSYLSGDKNEYKPIMSLKQTLGFKLTDISIIQSSTKLTEWIDTEPYYYVNTDITDTILNKNIFKILFSSNNYGKNEILADYSINIDVPSDSEKTYNLKNNNLFTVLDNDYYNATIDNTIFTKEIIQYQDAVSSAFTVYNTLRKTGKGVITDFNDVDDNFNNVKSTVTSAILPTTNNIEYLNENNVLVNYKGWLENSITATHIEFTTQVNQFYENLKKYNILKYSEENKLPFKNKIISYNKYYYEPYIDRSLKIYTGFLNTDSLCSKGVNAEKDYLFNGVLSNSNTTTMPLTYEVTKCVEQILTNVGTSDNSSEHIFGNNCKLTTLQIDYLNYDSLSLEHILNEPYLSYTYNNENKKSILNNIVSSDYKHWNDNLLFPNSKYNYGIYATQDNYHINLKNYWNNNTWLVVSVPVNLSIYPLINKKINYTFAEYINKHSVFDFTSLLYFSEITNNKTYGIQENTKINSDYDVTSIYRNIFDLDTRKTFVSVFDNAAEMVTVNSDNSVSQKYNMLTYYYNRRLEGTLLCPEDFDNNFNINNIFNATGVKNGNVYTQKYKIYFIKLTNFNGKNIREKNAVPTNGKLNLCILPNEINNWFDNNFSNSVYQNKNILFSNTITNEEVTDNLVESVFSERLTTLISAGSIETRLNHRLNVEFNPDRNPAPPDYLIDRTYDTINNLTPGILAKDGITIDPKHIQLGYNNIMYDLYYNSHCNINSQTEIFNMVNLNLNSLRIKYVNNLTLIWSPWPKDYLNTSAFKNIISLDDISYYSISTNGKQPFIPYTRNIVENWVNNNEYYKPYFDKSGFKRLICFEDFTLYKNKILSWHGWQNLLYVYLKFVQPEYFDNDAVQNFEMENSSLRYDPERDFHRLTIYEFINKLSLKFIWECNIMPSLWAVNLTSAEKALEESGFINGFCEFHRYYNTQSDDSDDLVCEHGVCINRDTQKFEFIGEIRDINFSNSDTIDNIPISTYIDSRQPLQFMNFNFFRDGNLGKSEFVTLTEGRLYENTDVKTENRWMNISIAGNDLDWYKEYIYFNNQNINQSKSKSNTIIDDTSIDCLNNEFEGYKKWLINVKKYLINDVEADIIIPKDNSEQVEKLRYLKEQVFLEEITSDKTLYEKENILSPYKLYENATDDSEVNNLNMLKFTSIKQSKSRLTYTSFDDLEKYEGLDFESYFSQYFKASVTAMSYYNGITKKDAGPLDLWHGESDAQFSSLKQVDWKNESNKDTRPDDYKQYVSTYIYESMLNSDHIPNMYSTDGNNNGVSLLSESFKYYIPFIKSVTNKRMFLFGNEYDMYKTDSEHKQVKIDYLFSNKFYDNVIFTPRAAFYLNVLTPFNINTHLDLLIDCSGLYSSYPSYTLEDKFSNAAYRLTNLNSVFYNYKYNLFRKSDNTELPFKVINNKFVVFPDYNYYNVEYTGDDYTRCISTVYDNIYDSYNTNNVNSIPTGNKIGIDAGTIFKDWYCLTLEKHIPAESAGGETNGLPDSYNYHTFVSDSKKYELFRFKSVPALMKLDSSQFNPDNFFGAHAPSRNYLIRGYRQIFRVDTLTSSSHNAFWYTHTTTPCTDHIITACDSYKSEMAAYSEWSTYVRKILFEFWKIMELDGAKKLFEISVDNATYCKNIYDNSSVQPDNIELKLIRSMTLNVLDKGGTTINSNQIALSNDVRLSSTGYSRVCQESFDINISPVYNSETSIEHKQMNCYVSTNVSNFVTVTKISDFKYKLSLNPNSPYFTNTNLPGTVTIIDEITGVSVSKEFTLYPCINEVAYIRWTTISSRNLSYNDNTTEITFNYYVSFKYHTNSFNRYYDLEYYFDDPECADYLTLGVPEIIGITSENRFTVRLKSNPPYNIGCRLFIRDKVTGITTYTDFNIIKSEGFKEIKLSRFAPSYLNEQGLGTPASKLNIDSEFTQDQTTYMRLSDIFNNDTTYTNRIYIECIGDINVIDPREGVNETLSFGELVNGTGGNTPFIKYTPEYLGWFTDNNCFKMVWYIRILPSDTFIGLDTARNNVYMFPWRALISFDIDDNNYSLTTHITNNTRVTIETVVINFNIYNDLIINRHTGEPAKIIRDIQVTESLYANSRSITHNLTGSYSNVSPRFENDKILCTLTSDLQGYPTGQAINVENPINESIPSAMLRAAYLFDVNTTRDDFSPIQMEIPELTTKIYTKTFITPYPKNFNKYDSILSINNIYNTDINMNKTDTGQIEEWFDSNTVLFSNSYGYTEHTTLKHINNSCKKLFYVNQAAGVAFKKIFTNNFIMGVDIFDTYTLTEDMVKSGSSGAVFISKFADNYFNDQPINNLLEYNILLSNGSTTFGCGSLNYVILYETNNSFTYIDAYQ